MIEQDYQAASNCVADYLSLDETYCDGPMPADFREYIADLEKMFLAGSEYAKEREK